MATEIWRHIRHKKLKVKTYPHNLQVCWTIDMDLLSKHTLILQSIEKDTEAPWYYSSVGKLKVKRDMMCSWGGLYYIGIHMEKIGSND